MGAHTKLAANVLVLDEDGNTVLLEAGQKVPAWASDQVGDHCYAAAKDDDDEDEDDGEPLEPGEEPARNASTAKWAAFAAEHDVEVADDAGRNDIIAALVLAGVIAE